MLFTLQKIISSDRSYLVCDVELCAHLKLRHRHDVTIMPIRGKTVGSLLLLRKCKGNCPQLERETGYPPVRSCSRGLLNQAVLPYVGCIVSILLASSIELTRNIKHVYKDLEHMCKYRARILL